MKCGDESDEWEFVAAFDPSSGGPWRSLEDEDGEYETYEDAEEAKKAFLRFAYWSLKSSQRRAYLDTLKPGPLDQDIRSYFEEVGLPSE